MKPPSNAPFYACMYKELAELVRTHGYALAVHGSLTRDFDVIAIPWTEIPSAPEVVVDDILRNFALSKVGELTPKLHGRLCQTIVMPTGGNAYIDLSFMPVVLSSAAAELKIALVEAA